MNAFFISKRKLFSHDDKFDSSLTSLNEKKGRTKQSMRKLSGVMLIFLHYSPATSRGVVAQLEQEVRLIVQ